MANSKLNTPWPAVTQAPPKLSAEEWNMTMLLGLAFVVMAVLQLTSFSDFRDALTSIGLTSTSAWAAALILAELWAAASFFKLRLSYAFRMASNFFAVLVSGFWFFETVRLVAADMTNLSNNGFFGKYLTQSPGWWTVVEATVVLFWTLWAVNLTQDSVSK